VACVLFRCLLSGRGMERSGNGCTFTDSAKRISDQSIQCNCFRSIRLKAKHSGNLRSDSGVVVDPGIWSYSVNYVRKVAVCLIDTYAE
jgi:hypothetical protein